MAELMLGIGAVLVVAIYMIREAEHEEELEAAFQEGYKRGLYTAVVKASADTEA